MAVGDKDFNADITKPPADIAELWNGTRWTEIPAAEPAGSTSLLLGVSCRIASDCTATGWWSPSNTSESFPLINHWDGTRWAVVPSPHPASLNDAVLASVSCPATGYCIAVDSDGGAVVYQQDSWSKVTKIDGNNAFTAVSCAATATCVATDQYDNVMYYAKG